MDDVCKHCGKRIVLVNWALGPGWTHWKAEHSSINDAHDYCMITRAEPAGLSVEGKPQ